jgi:uncharacterized protein (TIGR00251 family)
LMVKSSIRKIDRGVAFTAKVVPGSSRTCFSGLLDGMVKVKVSAAPEKGKANQCLIAFLAKQLGVKKNAVSIVSGKSNPVKQVEIAGISLERLMKELNLRA